MEIYASQTSPLPSSSSPFGVQQALSRVSNQKPARANGRSPFSPADQALPASTVTQSSTPASTPSNAQYGTPVSVSEWLNLSPTKEESKSNLHTPVAQTQPTTGRPENQNMPSDIAYDDSLMPLAGRSIISPFHHNLSSEKSYPPSPFPFASALKTRPLPHHVFPMTPASSQSLSQSHTEKRSFSQNLSTLSQSSPGLPALLSPLPTQPGTSSPGMSAQFTRSSASPSKYMDPHSFDNFPRAPHVAPSRFARQASFTSALRSTVLAGDSSPVTDDRLDGEGSEYFSTEEHLSLSRSPSPTSPTPSKPRTSHSTPRVTSAAGSSRIGSSPMVHRGRKRRRSSVDESVSGVDADKEERSGEDDDEAHINPFVPVAAPELGAGGAPTVIRHTLRPCYTQDDAPPSDIDTQSDRSSTASSCSVRSDRGGGAAVTHYTRSTLRALKAIGYSDADFDGGLSDTAAVDPSADLDLDPHDAAHAAKRRRVRLILTPLPALATDTGEYTRPSSRSASPDRPRTPESTRTSPGLGDDLYPCVPQQRTFPSDIPISLEFPQFYRRFPVPSHFKPGSPLDVCVSGGSSSPRKPIASLKGCNFNEPAEGPLDLYAPRYVKGSGREKVGLCPICVEPPRRGGEGKKLLLKTKVSAYSISAVTHLPFSPPIEFKTGKRIKVKKGERTEFLEGKCHRCLKWITLVGAKEGDVSVKELFWWKHASSCHKASTIEGERDLYIEDDIYKKAKTFLDADDTSDHSPIPA